MPKIFQIADELVWKSSRNNVCALTRVRFSAMPPPIIKATSDLGMEWFIVRLQSWFRLVVRLFGFDYFRPETNPVARLPDFPPPTSQGHGALGALKSSSC